MAKSLRPTMTTFSEAQVKREGCLGPNSCSCRGHWCKPWGHHTRSLSSVLAGPSSHLTRALTVDRTTLDSRNSGVTRMWNSEREAKATEGEKSAPLKKLTWPTKVCGQRHM